ncbi:MAG TPA: cohesin domain-containing protein [Candidatus Bathyarchaeia archaeon]|nr:cohesin domain-containing protein [Candidatus Bathyarchaeia archaeon]
MLRGTAEASGTVLEVVPQAVTKQIGESFNVSIQIVDVQMLYGVQVLLRWDPSILEATAATSHLGVEDHPDGVLHNEVFTVTDRINQTSGEYALAAASLAPAGSFNGSGTVAVITFWVEENGSCTLTLDPQSTLAGIVKPGGTIFEIPKTLVNGYFTTSAVPEYTSFMILSLFMVATLLTAYLITRKKEFTL